MCYSQLPRYSSDKKYLYSSVAPCGIAGKLETKCSSGPRVGGLIHNPFKRALVG